MNNLMIPLAAVICAAGVLLLYYYFVRIKRKQVTDKIDPEPIEDIGTINFSE